MRYLIFFIAFLFAVVTKGQTSKKQTPTLAIVLTSENDNYISEKDRYYTNGMRIGIHFLRKKHLLKTSDKTIIRFQLAQEIYTPSNIASKNALRFDRPYAGYLHLEAAAQMYWQQKNSFLLGADIGIIGPAAGGGRVQNWWHEVINYPQAEGWQHQLRNEWVATIKMEYTRQLYLVKWADVTTVSRMHAGTAFNSLSQGGIARIGKIASIDHSMLTYSRLAHKLKAKAEKEFYIFYQFTSVYVLHNALIEGSLLRKAENFHTKKAVSFVFRQTTGIAYSGNTGGIKIFVCELSPEVVGGDRHHYGGIELIFGF